MKPQWKIPPCYRAVPAFGKPLAGKCAGYGFAGLGSAGNNDFNFNNNRHNVRLSNRLDYPLEMAPFLFRASVDIMKTYANLFQNLCSYNNLFAAYWNARRHKTLKPYVVDFESDLENNLCKLQWELLTHSYKPRPLKTFTVRDPKTRKISAANFRDRVIHHALCNIIAPIFESRFIHDTYANRKGKGTLAALKRFDFFLRKVSGNGKAEYWGGGTRYSHFRLCSQMRHLALF